MQYDYVIIGSGFGGSVSALRLTEKGYKALVIEKGRWYKTEDFPKTNWELKKWLWEPKLGCFGFFKMTFLNHVSIVSGVGVGGGSLTYACTLPVPEKDFFNTGSWKNLADWEQELEPFYKTAYQMLGADYNPRLFEADEAIRQLSREIGKEAYFGTTKVSVFFGEPGKTVPDPFFEGKGPERSGCIHCGACMTGCRHNAKNTLDKNYLYLAQQLGAEILAEKEVYDVVPLDGQDGATGYRICFKPSSRKWGKQSEEVTAKGVIFAGGVLGTVPLLLELKEKSLPRLSEKTGCQVRTNNESLILVTSLEKNEKDFSKGLAIGSILHTDKNTHLEPTRYGEGSSFFKTITLPMVSGGNGFIRLLKLFFIILSSPLQYARAVFLKNYASKTTILLFMQTLDSTLRIKRGRLTKMKTVKEDGPAPSAFIPEAQMLAKKYERIVNGKSFVSFADTLLGNPTTAHILGGAVMGSDPAEGVIDKDNRVFGYQNMFVCDGSMISANPGVNPALSITAISERAMSRVPARNA
jgi:cholesterol oxidase